MFTVFFGDKKFRTHSLDRVARRLYGRNAVAIIQEEHEDVTTGVIAVPDRKRPNVLVAKEHFKTQNAA